MSDNPILRDLPDEGYGLECDWGGCGHTAVKERQVATGVWLPVCACCAHKPDLSPPEKAYEDALGIIQDDGERIAALTAENARLRGEVERLEDGMEQSEDARCRANSELHDADLNHLDDERRITALTADLARVSDEYERVEHDRSNLLCEREELRDRLRNVCGIAREAYKPNGLSDTEQLCTVLTAIISACASPASGEVKP